MHFPSFIALSLLLASPSLTLTPARPAAVSQSPPNVTGPAPIGVPICYRSSKPNFFSLLLCARLLTNLKYLPAYTKEEVWSKFVAGKSHLPAVFQQTDPMLPGQSCYLTIDLYQTPSVPITALERFSLQEEQSDLNRIYFNCLKNGKYGIERIGTKGNVAALLGPQYANDALGGEGQFAGMFANGSMNESSNVVDLTSVVAEA